MISILKTKITIFSLLLAAGLPATTGCAAKSVKPVVVAEGPKAAEETGLTAEKVVRDSLEAYGGIEDYTAVVHKEERFGAGPLRPKETIFVKFRKPNQIYMKWIEEPNKGMELIYPVKGNKLVVEPGGLLDLVTPRLYLNPTDKLALRDNRHPVSEAGIGFLIEQYARDFSRAAGKNEARVIFENPSQIAGRPAHRVETVLPSSPDSGYYCYRSVVYFDAETKLPLQAEFYDWDNKIFERYSFTQVQINAGLTDKDFDENNPQYDF